MLGLIQSCSNFFWQKNPHILYVLNIVKSCLLHICKFWIVFFFYHFGWSKRSISLMVNSQGLGWPRNCCHRGLGGCFAIPGPGACLAEKSVDRWVIGDKKRASDVKIWPSVCKTVGLTVCLTIHYINGYSHIYIAIYSLIWSLWKIDSLGDHLYIAGLALADYTYVEIYHL